MPPYSFNIIGSRNSVQNFFNLTRVRSMTGSSKDTIEKCKAAAAVKAVDENIHGDCIVGIGSGSTMSYVLERLAYRCKVNSYSIKCIPTSFQSKQLIYDYDLPITEIDCNPVIDVTIDGADEVDKNLVAIKGGGACLAQEKVVAFAAKKFVIVADHRKNSSILGQNWIKGIPIEILPMACNSVRQHICNLFDIELADLVVRIGKEKAGPVITDNGNLVLDWKFNSNSMKDYSSADWGAVADKIKLLPGVVDTGLFVGIIREAYFGQPDGSVIKRAAQ